MAERTTSRFIPNPALESEVLNGLELGAYLTVVGIAAKREAKAMAERRLSPIGGPRYGNWHRAGNRAFKHGGSRPPGRTGEYDGKFFYRIRRVGTGLTLGFGNNADYASIVERGSRAAIIPHSNKKVVFYSNTMKSYVWANKVRHPGAFTTHATNKRVTRKGAYIVTDALALALRLSESYSVPLPSI